MHIHAWYHTQTLGEELSNHLHGGPFSERPTRAKSLSLRSPATCRIKHKPKLTHAAKCKASVFQISD